MPTAPDDPVDDRAALERYARAAAMTAGLEIDQAWWPGVVRHLGVILERADSLDADFLPHDPAPVFVP